MLSNMYYIIAFC